MGKPSEDSEAISLDAERTKKFLRTLAEDPFLAVTVEADGEVTIYSCGLEPEHLERIKQALSDIQQEG